MCYHTVLCCNVCYLPALATHYCFMHRSTESPAARPSIALAVNDFASLPRRPVAGLTIGRIRMPILKISTVGSSSADFQCAAPEVTILLPLNLSAVEVSGAGSADSAVPLALLVTPVRGDAACNPDAPPTTPGTTLEGAAGAAAAEAEAAGAPESAESIATRRVEIRFASGHEGNACVPVGAWNRSVAQVSQWVDSSFRLVQPETLCAHPPSTNHRPFPSYLLLLSRCRSRLHSRSGTRSSALAGRTECPSTRHHHTQGDSRVPFIHRLPLLQVHHQPTWTPSSRSKQAPMATTGHRSRPRIILPAEAVAVVEAEAVEVAESDQIDPAS